MVILAPQEASRINSWSSRSPYVTSR